MTGAGLATKTDLKSEVATLRFELKADMRDLEQRMMIKLGGMLVVTVGVLVAAQRFLPPVH